MKFSATNVCRLTRGGITPGVMHVIFIYLIIINPVYFRCLGYSLAGCVKFMLASSH